MKISDKVLYKNNQLIAFNKPGNLPVQADKTGDDSLQKLAEIYSKHPVQIVHRIDRPASGVVIFANSKLALTRMNEQFKNRSIDKTYLAVVRTKPEKEEGTLIHYLTKNGRTNKTQVSDEPAEGAKRAELSYKLVAKSDTFFLLEIKLITGRHHQIRAQLAAIGSPIKGDVKYGARRGNKDKSIHLHAWKAAFDHPVTGEREEIIAPIPTEDPVWKGMNFGV